MNDPYEVPQPRPRKLYPWSLSQLRLPHTAQEPIQLQEDSDLLRIATSAIRKLRDIQQSILVYKISAYSILTLVVEAMELFDLVGYEEDYQSLIDYMPMLLTIAHGESYPATIPRNFISRLRYIHFDLDQNEIGDEDTPENRNLHSIASLFAAAEMASEAIAGEPRTRSASLDVLAYRENETDSLAADNISALFNLILTVNRNFGEEEVQNILNIWWNRTFARLAFIQEEIEYIPLPSQIIGEAQAAYMIEYRATGDMRVFYGNTREEVVAYAAAYDPHWRLVSNVWAWNGDAYQRDDL